MSVYTDFKKKHKEAIKALQVAAQPKVDKHGRIHCFKIIAKNLNVAKSTISNYVDGRTKDGYLTEAITKEFEKL